MALVSEVGGQCALDGSIQFSTHFLSLFSWVGLVPDGSKMDTGLALMEPKFWQSPEGGTAVGVLGKLNPEG